MWKLAALAWLPTSAVLFGALIIVITLMPELTRDFTTGAAAIYGAAALSGVLAAPLSWWVARRMLTRRERRRLDAMGGQGVG